MKTLNALGCFLAGMIMMGLINRSYYEPPTTKKATVFVTPDRLSVIWIQANNWTNGESTFHIPPSIDKTNLAKAVWRWAQSEVSHITTGSNNTAYGSDAPASIDPSGLRFERIAGPSTNKPRASLNVYQTYVDSANYERVEFENLTKTNDFGFTFRVRMSSAGVGVDRPVRLLLDRYQVLIGTNGLVDLLLLP